MRNQAEYKKLRKEAKSKTRWAMKEYENLDGYQNKNPGVLSRQLISEWVARGDKEPIEVKR